MDAILSVEYRCTFIWRLLPDLGLRSVPGDTLNLDCCRAHQWQVFGRCEWGTHMCPVVSVGLSSSTRWCHIG